MKNCSSTRDTRHSAALPQHHTGADETDAGNNLSRDARVVAAYVGRHFVRHDRKEGRADADQHHGAKAGGFVAQFALKSDRATERSGEQEPLDDYDVQVVKHRVPPSSRQRGSISLG